MEGFLRQLAINSIEAMFPRFCLRCRKEGSLFCLPCQESYYIAPMQAQCPFCEKKGSAFTCLSCCEETYLDGLISLAPYADPFLRSLITMWKYEGDSMAEEVVALMLRRVNIWLPPVDLVSYVPLHRSRMRARGFDQAKRLAELLGEARSEPVGPLLERIRKTTPQARVTQSERLVGDLDGVFSTHGTIPKRVLLCDDVFTSGATMDACAKVLKEAGVREVWGFSLAKGSIH